MKFTIKYTLALSFLFISNFCWAQKMSLQEAIHYAVENNLRIKASEIKVHYSKTLVSTAQSIPKTNIEMQYGNIQIPNVSDYAFTISQPFQNPKVNKARTELYEKYVNQAFTASQIEVLNVKKEVRLAYYQSAYFSKLLDLINARDTLYSKALRRAEVRFRAGETSVLEKTNLETQKDALSNQFNITKYNLEKSKNVLVRITQWKNETFTVETAELEKELLIENLNYEGPLFESFQRLQEINTAEKNLASAKLKPDFVAGITNQSMDKSLSQFVIIGGINIPIFQKAEKAKVASFEVQRNAIQADELAFQNNLQSVFNSLTTELLSRNKQLEYLSETATPKAELIIKTAHEQYLQGAISYLEYQQNFRQAFELKEQYLLKLLEQKNIETELFYLLGK